MSHALWPSSTSYRTRKTRKIRRLKKRGEALVGLRGGSRGRGRGCAPPPWDDLLFSNTTGILQKKKKLCGLLVLKWSKRRVHPLLKKSWIRAWDCKEDVIVPIVVGTLGTVISKRLHLYLKKAGLDGSI